MEFGFLADYLGGESVRDARIEDGEAAGVVVCDKAVGRAEIRGFLTLKLRHCIFYYGGWLIDKFIDIDDDFDFSKRNVHCCFPDRPLSLYDTAKAICQMERTTVRQITNQKKKYHEMGSDFVGHFGHTNAVQCRILILTACRFVSCGLNQQESGQIYPQ